MTFNQGKRKVRHLGWNNPLLGLGAGWLSWEQPHGRQAGQGSVDHPCRSEDKLHVELH